MCKIAPLDCLFHLEDMSTLPERRSYRTHMRRASAGRASARHRVAINRFWNEMEEFYDRHEERKAREAGNARLIKELRSMPSYTTDWWDHDREQAENRINESMEEEEEEGKFVLRKNAKRQDVSSRARLESSDVMLDGISDDDSVCSSASSSSGSFSLSFNNVWDREEDSSLLPSPPSKLPDLKNFILF